MGLVIMAQKEMMSNEERENETWNDCCSCITAVMIMSMGLGEIRLTDFTGQFGLYSLHASSQLDDLFFILKVDQVLIQQKR